MSSASPDNTLVEWILRREKDVAPRPKTLSAKRKTFAFGEEDCTRNRCSDLRMEGETMAMVAPDKICWMRNFFAEPKQLLCSILRVSTIFERFY